jgi:pSer/pThr/pTyr-binding forkhead associated (FHA) protein
VALAPEIAVRTPDGRTCSFTTEFLIGRDRECDVRIDDGRVSRRHARARFDGHEWRIADLGSGNGLWMQHRRVHSVPVGAGVSIGLGPEGPQIDFETDARQGETVVLDRVSDRYFRHDSDGPAGRETVMIRKAFRRVQKRQRRVYGAIIGGVAALGIAAGGYAYYNQRQLARQQALAESIFYTMKANDVELASLEVKLAAAGNARGQDDVRRYQERRRQLEINYEQYLSGLSGRHFTPQEKAILRITRLFGECDVAAPPEYMAQVMTYIRAWQSTTRYRNAVERAQQQGYVRRIVEEFQRQNLPPQFFYLAMQESSFVETATGPATRMGYAKGMWMFIPDTARRYGLTVGPLQRYARPDPGDDRHNWERATRAAAAYIKDIYSTDAQASGLLVMASYNLGEGRIINLLRSMPANPRERNFWKLLLQHRRQVPDETYKYVFSIVAAAAIGENPRLFGFSFDDPLATLEGRPAARQVPPSVPNAN